MKIPEPEHSIKNLIDKAHASNIEQPRHHLGCSQIGHKCDRYLWYSFRWAFVEKFEGRMLRLFRRGRDEEKTVISDLRMIGVDVRGTQTQVDFGAHVGGSADGIIYSGLPNAPKTKAVLEIKTHSDSSFNKLLKDGVQKSKPLHYTQMMVYALGLKLDRALYYAVNKNTDEIYTEYLHLDKEHAQKAIERAKRITLLERKPEPMTADPTWYECQYCTAKGMCHKNEPTQQANCRTCAHATPLENSTWHCARWDSEIPKDAQYQGCDSHVLHPDLVPYQMKPAHDEWHAIYIINNKEVINGAEGFKSTEIIANPDECANPSEFTKELRETMGAKIC